MIRIERHPLGPRVWICGQRIHHGAVGCLLVLAALKRRHALIVAGILIAHDRADVREWFRIGA